MGQNQIDKFLETLTIPDVLRALAALWDDPQPEGFREPEGHALFFMEKSFPVRAIVTFAARERDGTDLPRRGFENRDQRCEDELKRLKFDVRDV